MYGLLTEIKRQNPGLIIRACQSIKDGKPFVTSRKFDPETGDDLLMVECSAEEQWDALERIIGSVRAGKRFDAVWDVQVLVARNDERHKFNKLLQNLLNPIYAEAEHASQAGQRASASEPDVRLERRHANECQGQQQRHEDDYRRADLPVRPELGQRDSQAHSGLQTSRYRVGDKLICLKNCLLPAHGLTHIHADPRAVASYDIAREPATGQPVQTFVANGDIGRVEAVEPRVIVAKFLTPPRVVKIPMGAKKSDAAQSATESAKDASGQGDERETGSGADFDLAYAITCHKSQGSEWPVVVVMIDEGGGMVTSKNWAYTAVSRAAQLCVLIGRKSVMLRQCRRDGLQRRKTFLAQLLTEQPR